MRNYMGLKGKRKEAVGLFNGLERKKFYEIQGWEEFKIINKIGFQC